MVILLTWGVNDDTKGGRVSITIAKNLEEVVNINIEIDTCVIITNLEHPVDFFYCDL